MEFYSIIILYYKWELLKMERRSIQKENLLCFVEFLHDSEKSQATCEKYLRDVNAFMAFCRNNTVTKEVVFQWKQHLMDRGYAVRSINSMLSSLNSFLDLMGWSDCKVKNLRLQQQIYTPEEKEITKSEYVRLLNAARANEQLYLVIQTICSTGIRVSELRHFTVEGVKKGQVIVRSKNKSRIIFVPGKLKKMILQYVKKRKISVGSVFLGKNGKPLDRSHIWRLMKGLCIKANVMKSKVFPHNLRKLFARTFYNLEKDIAKLADILGHSSINTTRIYIMSTGSEHRRKIEKLNLLI